MLNNAWNWALHWLDANSAWIGVLAVVSLVAFVGTLLAIPFLVLQIPTDYFEDRERGISRWADRHPVLQIAWIVGKNLLGGLLLIAGIAMLVLPGQGLLTILIGLMLIDFPGKYRLERWLVTRPPVWKLIAWLRVRAGRPPIQPPRD